LPTTLSGSFLHRFIITEHCPARSRTLLVLRKRNERCGAQHGVTNRRTKAGEPSWEPEAERPSWQPSSTPN
jgi:hypothetical protein